MLPIILHVEERIMESREGVIREKKMGIRISGGISLAVTSFVILKKNE
jgi:hypothetical protein